MHVYSYVEYMYYIHEQMNRVGKKQMSNSHQTGICVVLIKITKHNWYQATMYDERIAKLLMH